jgi:Carboxypeptidase regulatory-like domain/Immunoglobulin I-set domain
MRLFVLGARRWLAAVMVACVAGCGGGGDGADAQTPPAPAAASTGVVSGQVLASESGQPVANAKVSLGALSAQTDAQGRFTLSGVGTAPRQVIDVRADGFGKSFGVVEVRADATSDVTLRLVRSAPVQTFAADAAATLVVPQSMAQVQLPANGLVDAATGAAASGTLSATLTPIDPARDPQTMPGDYTNAAGASIESFGALSVELADATGARLNLKPGSVATVRIALATRSATPPASVPLFYFNESSGRWVEEGRATLQGAAPNQYYEGTVTHFTFWNADQVADTIVVRGCLRNAGGAAAGNVPMRSEGLDYTGNATRNTAADGRFELPMRRGGRAVIYSPSGNGSNAVNVGPSQTDITLPDCLVLAAAATAPVIVAPPQDQTVALGSVLIMSTAARGSEPLSYQWQFNGADIAGANGSRLFRGPLNATDAGTYTLIVTNPLGSARATAVVTVAQPLPVITTAPQSQSVVAGGTATFSVVASGAGNYQWRRNGVNIAGATQASFAVVSAALADNGARFDVVVTSAGGSVTSSEATLSVTASAVAPSIGTQPANASAAVGGTATFSVVVTGTAPLAYQWRRNGQNIAGATAASYTTPLLAAADDGAVFSVVVSNAQGAVTSSNATLTVTANTADAQAALLRLTGSSVELFSLGFSAFEVADDASIVQSSSAVCARGGSYQGTLDGAPLAVGTVLPTSGNPLEVGFASCATQNGFIYNGSSSVVFSGLRASGLSNGSGTATLTSLRQTAIESGSTTVDSDVTGNGAVAVTVAENLATGEKTSAILITPGANASLRNELSGRTAVFQSGSLQLRLTGSTTNAQIRSTRAQYNALRFTVSGVEYTADGFYQFGIGANGVTSGSGEVILRSGSTTIGRIFANASGVFIEVNGQVQPL